MNITLFPFLTDEAVLVYVVGDVITINGDSVDLSGVPEGYRLPGDATGNQWLSSGAVERIGGVLCLTLRQPVHVDSPEEFRNPSRPILIAASRGKVDLPDTSPPVIPSRPIPPEVATDG